MVKSYIALVLLVILLGFGYIGVSNFFYIHNSSCYITLPEPESVTVPIYSLNDNWITKGSFMLGSGCVKQEPVYTFYTGNDDVGYISETIPIKNTRIFMDENTQPYYKITKSYVMMEIWLTQCGMPVYMTTFELHVPKGTIVENYKLDGE